MSHPFGDLLSQHLHRKHGLSQSKLAEGILQAPTVITGMCKGRRLTGPQARERVLAIIDWLRQQRVLSTESEANALLNAAGMAHLQQNPQAEAALLGLLAKPVGHTGKAVTDHFSDFTATNHDGRTASSISPSVKHNLPAQFTPFVGRTLELAELAILLANPDVRLVTLVGSGGIGKTRLALATALQHVAYFSDGVYFVSLAGVDAAYGIIHQIATVLSFSFYAGGTPHQQLCDYLRHKDMLLVLDNFEHLITPVTTRETRPDAHSSEELNGVSLLLGLLQSAPQLKVLVTSRVRLNVQGEQLYGIDGIDFPQVDSMTLAEVGQTGAVDLFVQSARRVQASFTLTKENMGAVAHICRLVQGMPLAILLAAGWMELLTPSEVLTELNRSDHHDGSLDFLTTDQQNVPARHRSLRALFDHSWHLLNESEQKSFAQLSVFGGGFTLEAAKAVNGIVPLALRKLVNKSLVRRQATGRYDLHELLRQYAAYCLTQTPALRDLAHAQHSAFYCRLLSKQEARLKGAEQQATLVQIDLELDNLRSAWHWAVEHEQIGHIAQAMPSLGLCYLWSSRYQEGEVTYTNTVRKLYTIRNQTPPVQLVLAQALAWQSVFTRHTKPLAESMGLLQQSMALLENLPLDAADTYLARAFILLQLGRQCEMQSEFAAAQQHYQQALALYRVLDDAWGQASVLAGLAEITRRSGEFQASLQLYEASLALFRQLGDDRGSAHVLTWLGFALRERAKFVEAEEVTKEAIMLYTRMGDRARIAIGHFALGWAYIYAGRFAEAYTVVENGLTLEEELGLPISLSTLGLINVELGNYQKAAHQLGLQLVRSRKLGDKDELSLTLDLLICLAVVEARYGDAQQLLAEATTLHQELGEQHRLTHSYAWLGYTARGFGQRAEAEHHFFQALQLTVANPGFSAILFTLPGIALLFTDLGEVERAIEIYAQIADLPLVANSQMRWDLAGNHLATVAATLTPEVVIAARARGKAGELWGSAATLLIELGNRGWGKAA